MSDYFCDLHVHSCLSPCGDDDMTPANIAAMAALNGLNIVALTDHNSAKNCPAFFAQARKNGIIPVGGMEITTSEDIHAVCLFRTLEDAMDFDSYVESHLMNIKNRADIFGHQYIVDEDDTIVGEVENLLIGATDISLSEAFYEAAGRGGVCYPAHIDRQSNGVIAVLGSFPEEPVFTAYELNDERSDAVYRERFSGIRNLVKAVSSDAHYLWDIAERSFSVTLDDEPYSSAFVRNRLIDHFLGVV